MPLYFGAGKINTTRKIINTKQYVENPVCNCPVQDKTSINTSSDNNNQYTENQRIADLVRNSLGGRVQYGNNINRQQLATFLGRTEGQPGGIIGPLRNKF
jgi:hypothetical protein